MPVAESPSYHGYDVADYKAIEKDYGTADDFRALMAAAHARGIDVIVDLVLNHTSIDHPWFQDSRTPGSKHDDWYVWSDQKPPFARSRRPARLAQGWRPLVLRLLLGEHAGPEPQEPGRHGRPGRRRPLLAGRPGRGRLPSRCGPSSDRGWQDPPEHARDVRLAGRIPRPGPRRQARRSRPGRGSGTRRSSPPGTSARARWTWTSSSTSPTRCPARSDRTTPGRTARPRPRSRPATRPTDTAPSCPTTTRTGSSPSSAAIAAAARLAATLLFTSPGVPFVYYGEEIGLTGAKPDERIRTPMRWDAHGPGRRLQHRDAVGAPQRRSRDDERGRRVGRSARRCSRPIDPSSSCGPRTRPSRTVIGPLWRPPTAASTRTFARPTGKPILVVANLGDGPIAGPTLTLKAGPLCGVQTAVALLGDHAVRPPVIDFDRWVHRLRSGRSTRSR